MTACQVTQEKNKQFSLLLGKHGGRKIFATVLIHKIKGKDKKYSFRREWGVLEQIA